MSKYKNTKTKTVKRFSAWTKLKRKINDQGAIPDGKNENFDRPVLIVKGFSRYLFWGIPLSTTPKRGQYYHPIVVNGNVSTVLLSQLRTLDTRRFIRKYGMLNHKDFAEIKVKLIDFLS